MEEGYEGGNESYEDLYGSEYDSEQDRVLDLTEFEAPFYKRWPKNIAHKAGRATSAVGRGAKATWDFTKDLGMVIAYFAIVAGEGIRDGFGWLGGKIKSGFGKISDITMPSWFESLAKGPKKVEVISISRFGRLLNFLTLQVLFGLGLAVWFNFPFLNPLYVGLLCGLPIAPMIYHLVKGNYNDAYRYLMMTTLLASVLMVGPLLAPYIVIGETVATTILSIVGALSILHTGLIFKNAWNLQTTPFIVSLMRRALADITIAGAATLVFIALPGLALAWEIVLPIALTITLGFGTFNKALRKLEDGYGVHWGRRSARKNLLEHDDMHENKSDELSSDRNATFSNSPRTVPVQSKQRLSAEELNAQRGQTRGSSVLFEQMIVRGSGGDPSDSGSSLNNNNSGSIV